MDEWEAPQETLFWLSQDDCRETVAQARHGIAGGYGLTEDQIRAAFGVPKRSA